MGVLDTLRKVRNKVREGWRSTGPDSYFRYKRDHEHADRSAELERQEVRRGREYEERYAAERAAEEPQSQAPRDDTGKPE